MSPFSPSVLAFADAAAAPTRSTPGTCASIYPSEAGVVGGEGRRGRRHPQDRRPAAGSSPPPRGDARSSCLETYFDLDRRITQVSVYASMNYDLDTRVGRAQQMQEQARQARTAFSSASAWLRPEILAAGSDKIRALDRRRPAPRDLQAAAGRRPQAGVAHARLPSPSASSPETDLDVERGPGDPRRVRQRGSPLPESHAVERRDGHARCRRVHEVPRRRQPRGPAQGLHGVLGALQRVHAHAGDGAQRPGQAHEFSRKVRKFDSSVEAALFSGQHPDRGLHAADRGHPREPADAPPLPAAAAAHDGAGQAGLRGPLRPDRAALRPHVHPRRGEGR